MTQLPCFWWIYLPNDRTIGKTSHLTFIEGTPLILREPFCLALERSPSIEVRHKENGGVTVSLGPWGHLAMAPMAAVADRITDCHGAALAANWLSSWCGAGRTSDGFGEIWAKSLGKTSWIPRKLSWDGCEHAAIMCCSCCSDVWSCLKKENDGFGMNFDGFPGSFQTNGTCQTWSIGPFRDGTILWFSLAQLSDSFEIQPQSVWYLEGVSH